MPSLADSLNALSEHSAQIAHLSTANFLPAGPYTSALLDSLHLNPASTSSATLTPQSGAAGRRRREAADKGVLSLIRDAHESEVRLFKFIGESEAPGVGRTKRVEKREGVVTPLRNLQRGQGAGGGGGGGGGREGREGRDEVEIMLRTALRLVDDYRPMPRARSTITSLLDTHHAQIERVLELEQQIAEASSAPAAEQSSDGVASSSKPALTAGVKKKSRETPALSPDEAIKAEELALRALERKIAPLRKTTPFVADAAAASSRDASPEKDWPGASGGVQSSPPLPGRPTSGGLAHSHRTPAKSSGSDVPITNALVSATPRRPKTPSALPPNPAGAAWDDGRLDRFSPLKFLGTPRAKSRVSSKSTLREVMGSPVVRAEERVGSGIFGRRVTSGGGDAGALCSSEELGAGAETAGGSIGSQAKYTDEEDVGEEADAGAEEVEDADQTVRLGNGADSAGADAADVGPTEGGAPAGRGRQPQDTGVEGVRAELPAVQQAVAKIWDTLPEMMRQGVPDDTEVAQTPQATILHLARIARSDPPPPPSPSSHSTSTASAAPAAPKAPPIVPQTILVAHLLLILLRTAVPADEGESDGGEMSESMNEVKEQLSAIARARGWEGPGAAGGLGTKCVYHAVGKRVIKIERRAPNGGSIQFAL